MRLAGEGIASMKFLYEFPPNSNALAEFGTIYILTSSILGIPRYLLMKY
jgi:hypothetical protein